MPLFQEIQIVGLKIFSRLIFVMSQHNVAIAATAFTAILYEELRKRKRMQQRWQMSELFLLKGSIELVEMGKKVPLHI